MGDVYEIFSGSFPDSDKGLPYWEDRGARRCPEARKTADSLAFQYETGYSLTFCHLAIKTQMHGNNPGGCQPEQDDRASSTTPDDCEP